MDIVLDISTVTPLNVFGNKLPNLHIWLKSNYIGHKKHFSYTVMALKTLAIFEWQH